MACWAVLFCHGSRTLQWRKARLLQLHSTTSLAAWKMEELEPQLYKAEFELQPPYQPTIYEASQLAEGRWKPVVPSTVAPAFPEASFLPQARGMARPAIHAKHWHGIQDIDKAIECLR